MPKPKMRSGSPMPKAAARRSMSAWRGRGWKKPVRMGTRQPLTISARCDELREFAVKLTTCFSIASFHLPADLNNFSQIHHHGYDIDRQENRQHLKKVEWKNPMIGTDATKKLVPFRASATPRLSDSLRDFPRQGRLFLERTSRLNL